jgi:hypothetical protein
MLNIYVHHFEWPMDYIVLINLFVYSTNISIYSVQSKYKFMIWLQSLYLITSNP